VKGDAGRELTVVMPEQKAAFGWCVVTGQSREFLVEILKNRG